MLQPTPPNRLAKLRGEAGIAQAEIAVACGVHQGTVYRWERNEIDAIPSKYIPTLTALLDCSADELMGWDREPEELAA